VSVTAQEVRVTYDDAVVRRFIAASVIFGIVGMLVGVLIASQMAFWQLNFGIPYTTFSRLRPLHTNAVIFAFVGNMLFAGVYYSTQRLLKTRMASDLLSKVHFWGWQLIIVAAAVTLPLGITQGKEYAELEWPIDIAIAVIWVVFAINFFWTLAKRNEKHLYVALWFYISTIITVAVLHIVNSFALPLSPLKSYSVYAGVQDALVQWWYGHNAVAFFLTTPILGIMYYFLPKAAERPVYSYRLSIVHFWSLVFMYIWAGPHHLLNSALPTWAQSLGMVFSLMLWAPSWGGMINGLMTLRGAWDKVRTDPVIKFFIAGVTFYGMATFEGPLLSIKSVNALAHYTDWIIGHVHAGALGWNGFMAAGMFYWLVPRLYGTKLYSTKAADAHFWTGTVGILMYVVAMWISGITQGLMLRGLNPDGTLMYPAFVETLIAVRPMYMLRIAGGSLYFLGFVLMAWNLAKTALAGKAVDGQATVVVEREDAAQPSWAALLFGKPVLFVTALVVVMIFAGWGSTLRAVGALGLMTAVAVVGYVSLRRDGEKGKPAWHGLVEGAPFVFTLLSLVAILVGGVAELLPTILIKEAVPFRGETQKPYSALELQGRDIYVREGCYLCHSQMIRSLVAESVRYGEASRPEEFIYDHPFQWGSKRTGPDLQRVGGKYPNLWHYTHLMDPRATSPGSNMPTFPWLAEWKVDLKDGPKKLLLMQKLGVPYTNEEIDGAEAWQLAQGEVIANDLKAQQVNVAPDSEMVALIAYLQRLGRPPQMPLPGPKLSAANPEPTVGGTR
jgi:cytochrome c oxidase cbb3-type subunit I/II